MLRRMDAARAVLLLKARLDELERLSTANRDFEEWRQRTELTLRRVFHDDHKLVKDFQQVSFYPMAYPADAADYQRNFDSGRDSAVAVLKGAVYEVEELTELADFASGASIDPELWEHVEHLVEQEQWDQAASQTAIFVESRIRQWAGRPDSETTTRLMT